jgi:hypothetical protein
MSKKTIKDKLEGLPVNPLAPIKPSNIEDYVMGMMSNAKDFFNTPEGEGYIPDKFTGGVPTKEGIAYPPKALHGFAKNIDKDIKLENLIIDKMLSKLDSWEVDPIKEDTYSSLKLEDQVDNDMNAFKFFHQKYEEKQLENSKYNDISFENFIKLYRPENEFKKQLNNPDTYKEAYAAQAWYDVYGGDSNLMKQSALEGKKRAILNLDG